MTALSFVWVHPYSQICGCDNHISTEWSAGPEILINIPGIKTNRILCLLQEKFISTHSMCEPYWHVSN